MGMYHDPFIELKKISKAKSLVVIKNYSKGDVYYREVNSSKKGRWKKYKFPFELQSSMKIEAVIKNKGKEINSSSKELQL
jgi:hypothetical protein